MTIAATASGSSASVCSSVSGVAQWAIPSSSSTSGETKRGRSPPRTSPSIVEEWALRWTTTRSPEVGEREADRVVAARAAVDEEPRALGAPGLGRELLGALEAVDGRVLADVDPGDPGRDVHLDRALPEGLDQAGIGAAAALVAGDDEARPACGRRARRARRDTGSATGRPWRAHRDATREIRRPDGRLTLVQPRSPPLRRPSCCYLLRRPRGRRPPSKYGHRAALSAR